MKPSKKVYIVNGGRDYRQMFLSKGWELADTPEEADLVQFTGGEDVTPSIYEETSHPQTYSNRKRDEYEIGLYLSLREQEIPMAGICRGSQFLNVMCGGSLYQHVDGHATGAPHKAYDRTSGTTLYVSSTHHQMMRPGPSAEVLCVADESSFKEHMQGDEIRRVVDDKEDVEAVYYPDAKVLCFQPHPEFGILNHKYVECMEYYFNLIDTKLMG